jgi:hypothetical protein
MPSAYGTIARQQNAAGRRFAPGRHAGAAGVVVSQLGTPGLVRDAGERIAKVGGESVAASQIAAAVLVRSAGVQTTA